MKKSFIRFSLLLLIFLSFSFMSCVFNVVGIEDVHSEDIQGPTVVNDFPAGNRADVLMLFYMDGDNNLASAIWQDLNEIEYGLYCAEQNGGTSAKIDIFVLWDGNGNGDSKLYKLGSDNRLLGAGNVHTGLSKNTLDLSANISWIYNEKDKKYEVSMSNPKTLENYLKWISNHYIIDDDTQIILQFADHGGGPRSLSLSDSMAFNSRAMCQDENTVGSNNQELLWTKDIPNAIKASGILSNGKKKIDLVIQDVCNGASVEEAYEYKDVADYMLLSPNEMPAYGLNYVELISHIRDGDCISDRHLDVEKFLDRAVCDFIGYYKQNDNFWKNFENKLKEINKGLPIQEQLSDEAFTPLFVSMNYDKAATITALKLSEIQNLQGNIKELASILNDNGNMFTYDNNNVEKQADYLYALFHLVLRGMGKYQTYYGTLYDIGEFADDIIEFNKINKTGKSEIETVANNIKSCLNNIVLYSWRDGVGGALYNKSSRRDLTGIKPFDSGSYGLVISGISYDYNFNDEPVNLKFPGGIGKYDDRNFYSKELQFGKDTSEWENLMDNIIVSNRKSIFN